LNYWKVSGASGLIKLVGQVKKPPRSSHSVTNSTGQLLSISDPDQDLDDEEELLEALIRSEMGES